MLAFIRRSQTNPGAALYSIAGRPLLERQIEWLYDSGVDEIYLELGADELDLEIGRWLESSPLGLRVRVLKTSGGANDLSSLAREVSESLNCPVVSINSDQMARVDLSMYFGESLDGGVNLQLQAAGLGLDAGQVSISKPGQTPTRVIEANGWGARLATVSDGMTLSSALLNCGGKVRDFDLQIPGTEISPGVWVARGVRVSDKVEFRAPVYVGYGSWIQAGARVGPNCQIGEHVVVMSGAQIADAVVPSNVVVDEFGMHSSGKPEGRGILLRSMTLVLASPFLMTVEIARRCKDAVWG